MSELQIGTEFLIYFHRLNDFPICCCCSPFLRVASWCFLRCIQRHGHKIQISLLHPKTTSQWHHLFYDDEDVWCEKIRDNLHRFSIKRCIFYDPTEVKTIKSSRKRLFICIFQSNNLRLASWCSSPRLGNCSFMIESRVVNLRNSDELNWLASSRNICFDLWFVTTIITLDVNYRQLIRLTIQASPLRARSKKINSQKLSNQVKCGETVKMLLTAAGTCSMFI